MFRITLAIVFYAAVVYYIAKFCGFNDRPLPPPKTDR